MRKATSLMIAFVMIMSLGVPVFGEDAAGTEETADVVALDLPADDTENVAGNDGENGTDNHTEVEKAMITDVRLSGTGVTFDSNTNTYHITTESDTVTVTVIGTHLENASSENYVKINGLGVVGEGLPQDSEGNSYNVYQGSSFSGCVDKAEIVFTNNFSSGQTWISTGKYVVYDVGSTENDGTGENSTGNSGTAAGEDGGNIPPEAISVTLNWGNFHFVYSDEQINGQDKGWTCESGANQVSVSNNGGAAVMAEASYNQESEYNMILGSFGETAAATLSNGENAIFTLNLSGKPSANIENVEIGSVTVKITAAGN